GGSRRRLESSRPLQNSTAAKPTACGPWDYWGRGCSARTPCSLGGRRRRVKAVRANLLVVQLAGLKKACTPPPATVIQEEGTRGVRWGNDSPVRFRHEVV